MEGLSVMDKERGRHCERLGGGNMCRERLMERGS